jgi:hypothetical protein
VQKVTCEICGEEVKNLGVHKYHRHKETWEPKLVVDEHLPDKQLSVLVSDLKALLRQYRSDITVKTVEQGGTVSEIEITARIQLRR